MNSIKLLLIFILKAKVGITITSQCYKIYWFFFVYFGIKGINNFANFIICKGYLNSKKLLMVMNILTKIMFVCIQIIF